MAYRSEIIRALDELIANEAGDLFQSIATLHATQKWTQLVACERKWDGGLDAHADRATQPGGIGIGLACSITPTIKKIKRDARETNRHYPDVKVLIFSTATKVTQHEKQKWAKEILDEFGLQLIVVSRAEFINWLLDPARAKSVETKSESSRRCRRNWNLRLIALEKQLRKPLTTGIACTESLGDQ